MHLKRVIVTIVTISLLIASIYQVFQIYNISIYEQDDFIPPESVQQNPQLEKISKHNLQRNKIQSLPIMPKKFICFQSVGKWPSKMFAFASSYGIAKSLNMNLIVKSNFLPFFQMKITDSIIRHDTSLCRKTKRHTELKPASFDLKLFKKLRSSPRIYLDGYLQSWKYFQHVEKDIRKLFQFKEHLITKAHSRLQTIKDNVIQGGFEPENLMFVGIHIRRKGLERKMEEYMAPKAYYNNAINFFMDHFSNIIFIACTDSYEWAEANLPEFVQIMPQANTVADLCLLSHCNHTIMSSGAFGWWSSWLSNGITTYFRPSKKDRLQHLKRFSESNLDYYWPKWIAISGEP